MDYYFANRMPTLFDALQSMDRMDRSMDTRSLGSSALEMGTPSGVMSANPRYHHVAKDGTDILSVELPGVEKENVKLDVKGYFLHVSAERAYPGEDRKTQEKDSEGRQDANGDSEGRQDGSKGKDNGSKGKEEQTSGKVTGTKGNSVEVSLADGDGTTAQKVEHPSSMMTYSAKFSLGKNADVNGICADYKNGLLTVTVPHKKPETKRIELS